MDGVALRWTSDAPILRNLAHSGLFKLPRQRLTDSQRTSNRHALWPG